MLEMIGLGWIPGFVYNAVKDALGKSKKLTQQEKIKLRQKWKPEFEGHVRDQFAKKHRRDVIIRDVHRVDSYPEIKEEEKGISPWFRMGLVGTYHRGIYVSMHWNKLIPMPGGNFRVHDPFGIDKYADNIDEKAIKVLLLGMIPFENIESVDWGGDEYYYFPHIYCHFRNKGEPYERVAFFEEGQLFPESLPFYTELAETKEVKNASLRAGVKKPYI